MNGHEEVLVNLMIKAAISAHEGLFTSPMGDLIGEISPGKVDTQGMDWTAETRIRRIVKSFNLAIILVTEEAEPKRNEWPLYTNLSSTEEVMICDPIDRSSQMKDFLTQMSAGDKNLSILDRIKDVDIVEMWEKNIAEEPASITGGTTAISCLIGGKILASVIVNHIHQSIIIAVPAGIYLYKIDCSMKDLKNLSMSKIVKKGERLYFISSGKACSSVADRKRFVAFAGKKGYLENLQESEIFLDDCMAHIHHKQPGGPTRVLYLSNLQKGYGPVGFILSNGEKITEWIHWLSFVRYGKDVSGNPALLVYEISIKRPNTKEGILMSCHPTYSIFTQRNEGSFIDIAFLCRFPASSHYRAMLVVVPSDNHTMIDAMNKHGFRELSDCL